MGILIGDGRLNYQQEKVLEAYYTVSLIKYMTFTFDYQFMENPAYNAGRGPISIFSGRLHTQFQTSTSDLQQLVPSGERVFAVSTSIGVKSLPGAYLLMLNLFSASAIL
jgi:hypothetical protein